jgi:hypothetical protein
MVDGLGHMKQALELQRLLNRTDTLGRDLSREAMLTREIAQLEAAPLVAEMTTTTAQAVALRDAGQNASALASYRRAYTLQQRLNREFAETPAASMRNQESLEIEIATLESLELRDEVQRLAVAATDTKLPGLEAAKLFERALSVQQKLNSEYPRSQHASVEKVDTLEVARQSALSAEAADRVVFLDREVGNKLRAGDTAKVGEMLLEGARLQDKMFAETPRSRRLDAELRLKFNYLSLHRDDLADILKLVDGQFVPVPGTAVQMFATEVPQKIYEAVMRSNPSRQVGDSFPVESVSLTEAQEFCRRLSWVTGRVIRLPNETEMRAAVGKGPPVVLSGTAVKAVGSTPPNAAGFRELLGNVAEWLAPATTEAETSVIAGGAYDLAVADPAKIPMEKRGRLDRSRTIGFRVVRE